MTPEEWVDSICRWGETGLRGEVIQMVRAAQREAFEECAKVADLEEYKIRQYHTRGNVVDGIAHDKMAVAARIGMDIREKAKGI